MALWPMNVFFGSMLDSCSGSDPTNEPLLTDLGVTQRGTCKLMLSHRGTGGGRHVQNPLVNILRIIFRPNRPSLRRIHSKISGSVDIGMRNRFLFRKTFQFSIAVAIREKKRFLGPNTQNNSAKTRLIAYSATRSEKKGNKIEWFAIKFGMDSIVKYVLDILNSRISGEELSRTPNHWLARNSSKFYRTNSTIQNQFAASC